MKRMAILTLTAAILFGSAMASMAQSGKNVEAMLQQILNNQQQMQEDIHGLKERVAEQDKVIEQLRAQVQQQKAEVQAQVSELRENPPAAASNEPSALDIIASREQYDVARDLQHHVIFNIRKGEQKEWFQRVVKEFQIVVDEYPQAPEAPEALIRIARTYHRYLDEPAKAIEAYRKLIETYPGTKQAKEAQDRLAKLRS